ncbi:MAG TPA: sigma-70 family RNA polymerase sigma factor [Acidimicrobiales bacterium]|nr:sigma-70 family RNA polymerase sigma factor [Acidimicrobiales bacterium]
MAMGGFSGREIPLSDQMLDAWMAARALDEAPDPARERLHAELVDILRELVATRLTDRQRSIVEMYYFDGLTQEEIAAELGIAQQVVSRQLFGVVRDGKRVGGAIRRLRVVLDELGVQWV